ncbi:hypothetical protein AYK61_08770 [Rhodococcus sp. SBT000017]|nr:hypothetical protein AYK61_08770 [Rhodococcus sp. SBT000017]
MRAAVSLGVRRRSEARRPLTYSSCDTCTLSAAVNPTPPLELETYFRFVFLPDCHLERSLGLDVARMHPYRSKPGEKQTHEQ